MDRPFPTVDQLKQRHEAEFRALLRQALEHTRGNQSRAAGLLQVPLTSLRSMLARLGVRRKPMGRGRPPKSR